jgi:hypothetical protein
VNNDNFSARWLGSFNFSAGTYMFTARTDDGMRVSVDGNTIIDAWVDQLPTTYRVVRNLSAAAHQIRAEYYENGGGAAAQLTWQGGLALPFTKGETWYICQGYNGVSHTKTTMYLYGLDLSTDPSSPGKTGCNPATANASTGRDVLAPGSGRIADHYPKKQGMCINLDNGKSMWIGHLTDMAPIGRIELNARLGRVAAPAPGNNYYAHVHVQVHSGPGCAASGQSIPFTSANGTRLLGAPNMPKTEEISAYRGTALKRTY